MWNPVTILNAPRLPTIPLPTRNVTFSPFAEVYHFSPEQWYPSPPMTPQRLPPQLPVIPDTQNTQTPPQPAPQSHNVNTQQATQLHSRDHLLISRSANAKILPSPRPAPPPAVSLGMENPMHYKSPLPTSRHEYIPMHPPCRYDPPYRSRHKLRQFLRFLRRVFRFGC